MKENHQDVDNVTGSKYMDQEISKMFLIKDEILKWKKIIVENWISVLAISVIITLFFSYIKNQTPTLYLAQTKFMLKNEGVGSLFGGQMTGLTSLLGGGQMGTPLERTAEVISSDRIIGKSLLRNTVLYGKNDVVINHFINYTKNKSLLKYKKDKYLFDIKNEYKIEDLTFEKRKLFKLVKNLIITDKSNSIIQKSFDKKSGVLTLNCLHEDEEFAIMFSKIIYQELNNFFIEQMTYTSTSNALIMKNKVDSINSELQKVRRIFANQTDQSQGLLLQSDKVQLKSLALKEQMLNVMYAEALKNFQAYQFMNEAATPSLTLIDYPYSPIKEIKNNVFFYALVLFIFSNLLLYSLIRVIKIF